MKKTTQLLLLVTGVLFNVQVLGLTLRETVAHTLDSNPEMRAALNELKSREYEVKQARSGYLPTVSVDAGVGQETKRSPSTGDNDINLDRQELGLSASQLLFDGFATSSEVNRQKARVESASYSLAAIGEELALKTSKAYLDVMRFAALLDLSRATLWEHQNIYDQMKLRYKTGVGSKADFDQIEARLALANANMIVSQNNFADTQSAFHRLTGLYPTLESLLKPEIKVVLPASREIAQEQALMNHPTLKSASSDMHAARAQYKAAAAGYYPRITLEADKRWDKNVSGVEGDNEDLIVALRLRYDLYSGGAKKAKRRQTAYLYEESKDVRNNSRRQIIESLNLSWNALDAISAQIQYLSKHVDAATATKDAYKKQFNIGKRTLLDLLNTENEVTESKKALIHADYDQLYSHYRVLNAMGTLAQSL